ncbi:MAG: hypothetical protein GF404_10145 [candidate division Zixibacteria bacterium]|nr:hypothetical protein [candidate division Zixibacteria bacterium]
MIQSFTLFSGMKFDRRIFRRASARWQPRRGERGSSGKRKPELETASGIRVRSKLEKVCVDYLSEHRISFKYEPLLLLEGRKFRPDFYLPEFDLFLEIAGYTHMPFYRDRLGDKTDIYRKYNLAVKIIRPKNATHLCRELDRVLFGEE